MWGVTGKQSIFAGAWKNVGIRALEIAQIYPAGLS